MTGTAWCYRVAIVMLTTMIDVTIVQLNTGRYNHFVNIGLMPGMHSGGYLYTNNSDSIGYNGTCVDTTECSYLMCEERIYFVSLNHTSCDYESMDVRVVATAGYYMWSSLARLILCCLITSSMVVFNSIDHILMLVYVFAFIVYQIYSCIFVSHYIDVVTAARPHLPKFIVDSDDITIAICYSCVCVELLVSSSITLIQYYTIVTSKHERYNLIDEESIDRMNRGVAAADVTSWGKCDGHSTQVSPVATSSSGDM
jgi:hypothetical protein